MSVLIFGLSGNPVHLGHINAANAVSKFFDEVWMMVSNSSNTKNMINAEHRLAMLKIAVISNGNPKIKVCDYLIRNNIKESTYHLMKRLKSEYDYNFYFMIGSDNVADIDNWVEYEKLVKEIDFVIIERNGADNRALSNLSLFRQYIYFKANLPNISSSEIRDKISKRDLSFKDLLDYNVYNYIIDNKLYGLNEWNIL